MSLSKTYAIHTPFWQSPCWPSVFDTCSEPDGGRCRWHAATSARAVLTYEAAACMRQQFQRFDFSWVRLTVSILIYSAMVGLVSVATYALAVGPQRFGLEE